jgi:DNA-directed RNA polymerase subunit RPC12/RpoP
MGERNANIGPRYAVRLSDLEPYHLLTARCPFCGHTRRMRLWQLKAGRYPVIKLQEVEERLRCMRCGSRGEAQVLVTLAEPEPEAE